MDSGVKLAGLRCALLPTTAKCIYNPGCISTTELLQYIYMLIQTSYNFNIISAINISTHKSKVLLQSLRFFRMKKTYFVYFVQNVMQNNKVNMVS